MSNAGMMNQTKKLANDKEQGRVTSALFCNFYYLYESTGYT